MNLGDGRDIAIDALIALVILVGGFILARTLAALLYQIVRRTIPGMDEERADYLAGRMRTPLTLLVVGIAAYAALRSLSVLEPVRVVIDRVGFAVMVGAGVLLVQRAVTASMDWAASGSALVGGPVGHIMPLASRAANVAILLIGALLVLDQLGVEISPLLAGLGIGGVAVALALQPLLTNLFAGSYILSDASIRVGDHIALEKAGPEGRVESIGWRATRVRDLRDQSTIVVPNATLAAATVINYGPGGAVYATASCTLPTGLNLDAVERVLSDELAALASEREEVSAEANTTVRFEKFDGTNVVCVVRMRARSHSDVALLTHLIVKRVNTRLLAGSSERP